jgi:hypothetical protein
VHFGKVGTSVLGSGRCTMLRLLFASQYTGPQGTVCHIYDPGPFSHCVATENGFILLDYPG